MIAAAFCPAAEAANFTHPTYSSPIAISADNALVWVVNPSDNTVSVIRTDNNTLQAKLGVGTEPQSIALDPSNTFAYVADAASSDVAVIKILNATPDGFRTANATFMTTGAEPWDIVISPDGRRVFVANSAQDTITVIDAGTQQIIGNVALRTSKCNDPDQTRHYQPRGLAVTQDSKKLYVTRFLSFTNSGGQQGVDGGKEAAVCRLDIDTKSTNIANYKPAALILLEAQDTGFQFPNLGTDAFAFPNQLQSIVIRGDQAYLPNVAASPSDPLRFNVDTEAFVSIIDGVNGRKQTDASLSKFFLGGNGIGPNLDLGAQMPEGGKPTLFFANPWAIAFTSQKGNGFGYVVSAGSDLLVKVNVAGNGTLSFTGGPTTTRYIDLNDRTNPNTSGANAGKNPQGIVINDAGTTAYVANFVSRNVSVVDLTSDSVIGAIPTSGLPKPGTEPEERLVGAEMFFSSRGHFNRPPNTTISIDNRLSQNGWQACASCHFKGLTDGVVWTFNTGPRKSIALNGTFGPHNSQRVLNYSAIFDEVQDFELNIRNVSGPGPLATAQNCSAGAAGATSTFDPNHGLLLGDTNPQLAPCTINDFITPNSGRNEITVTLPGSTVAWPALTALVDWVQFAVRSPNAPLTDQQIAGGVSSKDIAAGNALFSAAGCQNCHGGPQWTSSIRNFNPPPAITDIFCEENTGPGTPPGCQTAAVNGNPVATQFLDAFLRDIGSWALNVPNSGNAIPNEPAIGAIEFATRTVVNGALQSSPQNGLGLDFTGTGHGNGFSPPSILSSFAGPPYYHNGACETLACVAADPVHRSAGTGQDILGSAKAQAQLVTFLESIDPSTPPF